MYEYLKGKIESLTPSNAVVECNGVGYILEISLSSYTKLKSFADTVGSDNSDGTGDKNNVIVYTHFVVREDAQILYGFADLRERELFRYLISVSGIGANTARMMLSSLSVDELVRAIISEDSQTISKVKGIGGKTAQRVIVDLHDKLKKQWLEGYANEDLGNLTKIQDLDNKNFNEALLALQTLGFNKVIIEKTLNKLLKEDIGMSVEELVKQALRRM